MNFTKEQCDAVVEYFSLKGRNNPDGSTTYVSCDHVLLGDVIFKIYSEDDDCGGMENKAECESLIELWLPFGNISLQSILAKAEWEEENYMLNVWEKVLKEKPVKELFGFLQTLI